MCKFIYLILIKPSRKINFKFFLACPQYISNRKMLCTWDASLDDGFYNFKFLYINTFIYLPFLLTKLKLLLEKSLLLTKLNLEIIFGPKLSLATKLLLKLEGIGKLLF